MKFESAPEMGKHEEEYKVAQERLSYIFQNREDDKLRELYEQIRWYAPITGVDAEEIIKKIEESYSKDSQEGFVNTSFEILKGLIDSRINNPEIFEKFARERILNKKENIKLSELMYYNVDLHNGAAFVHIAPGEYLKLGEIIRAFKDGMRELAKQVNENDKINEIQASSWIVAANPGLLEKAGFTVMGPISEEEKAKYFNGEKRPISWARMSREDLLKKYLEHSE